MRRFRTLPTTAVVTTRAGRRRPRLPSEQAVTRTGLRGWLTRHQAWLFLPLTLREGLALKLHGFQDLRRQTGRDRLVEDTLLVAHVAGYVTLFLTGCSLSARVAGWGSNRGLVRVSRPVRVHGRRASW